MPLCRRVVLHRADVLSADTQLRGGGRSDAVPNWCLHPVRRRDLCRARSIGGWKVSQPDVIDRVAIVVPVLNEER